MNWYNYIKTSGIGSVEYSLPKEPSHLMFDFYMLSLINGSYDNEKIEWAVKDIQDKLLPELKNKLLELLFFAISSELRHVEQYGDLNHMSEYITNNPSMFDQYGEEQAMDYQMMIERFDAMYAKNGRSAARNKFPEAVVKRFGEDNLDRIAAYLAAKTLIKTETDRKSFVEAAMFAFNEMAWETQFGGRLWADICDGWLNLYDANSPNEMMTWIDHVYDLQHNNDTVFDKMKEFSRFGGFKWINEALDYKAKIKEPFELYDMISPSMKSIAAYAIKAKYGKTLEELSSDQRQDIFLQQAINATNNILRINPDNFFAHVPELYRSKISPQIIHDALSFYLVNGTSHFLSSQSSGLVTDWDELFSFMVSKITYSPGRFETTSNQFKDNQEFLQLLVESFGDILMLEPERFNLLPSRLKALIQSSKELYRAIMSKNNPANQFRENVPIEPNMEDDIF